MVPFDGSMWFGVDPATVLAASPARFEALDEGYCQTFWDGELREPDVALYRDLDRWLEVIYGTAPDGTETWRELLPDGSPNHLRSAIPILPLLARARAVAARVDKGRPACGSVTATAVGSSSMPPA